MSGCERYEALTSLVLDGEATLEEIAELNRHLESCPDCRAYYEDVKRIHGIFAPQRAALPEGFSARVMARVRETAQDPIIPEEKKTIRFPGWKRWAALAACCAVAALGLWAFQGTGGVKGAMVSTDDAALASMQMTEQASSSEADHDGPAPLFDETEASPEDADEVPPPMTEGSKEAARSAAPASEGAAQPAGSSLADAADKKDAPADTPAEYDTENSVQPAPADPASDDGGPDREAAEADETTDEAEPEEQPEPEPDPEEEPVEDEETVEPVEIVNAPEPGILIAIGGGAAQNWLEQVLGLEWAAGGSYSLSAEQYAQLLALLDEAAESYRIESGGGYCLMTE